MNDIVHTRFFRHLAGIVVNLTILHIEETEVLIILSYQRAIDGLARGISLHLGICCRTCEHQGTQFFHHLRNNLCQNVFLRMDKFRSHLRAIADRLVANQMELVAIQVLTFGNVYQCAVGAETSGITTGQSALHLLEDTVGDGTDSAQRLNDDVLRHTDKEVSIGTHHVRVATGRDILIHIHCVIERATALCIVGVFKLKDFRNVRIAHVAVCTARTLRSVHEACKGFILGTIRQSDRYTTLDGHIQREIVFQC